MNKKIPKLIGSGAECWVYDLGNNKVYKHYYELSKKEILKIYKRAKKAAKHRIGPRVYDLKKDGYITEKVKCPVHFNNAEMDELESKAEKFGFWTNDFHCFNIGRKINQRAGKGKLVMIDFGPLSS